MVDLKQSVFENNFEISFVRIAKLVTSIFLLQPLLMVAKSPRKGISGPINKLPIRTARIKKRKSESQNEC